jgi:hypothetical protein
MSREPLAQGATSPADAENKAALEAFEPERAMRTCPVCGSPLTERKCKLFCPRPGCGYFLSCADFY